MTLILSCVTKDYAVQVSDRCLTDLNSGRVLDQEANKAVVLSNRVAFAYTGLARIEGKPADIWLRDILVPHESIGHAVQLIIDEATRAFGQMPGSPAAKRQAFIGAGWARFPHLGHDLRPFGVTISNAMDSDGRWLSGALPTFSGRGTCLRGPSWGYAWTHAGRLPRDRAVLLNRMIQGVVGRGLSPATMAQLFIREIRHMADWDRSIGRGLMVNSIPSAVIGRQDLFAISSMPTTSELCFAHLRHDDTVSAALGPHFVRPGGRVFSNFRSWRDGDSEFVQVDFKAA
jgi:hypothetical protein